jgi:hypothetical protein
VNKERGRGEENDEYVRNLEIREPYMKRRKVIERK